MPNRSSGSRRPAAPATSRRRRALGQHFLGNNDAARRMVDLFAPAATDTIVEIGPGRGALTGPLLDTGARVIAIEIDRDLASGLEQRFAARRNFRLVTADILRCDIAALVAGGPARVLANLPYAITGEALMVLFRSAGALTDMLLMLQREVVERIVAAPGGRIYGSLSVLCQYYTEPRAVMSLSPGSFTPPPAVSSTVVAMPFRRPRELAAARESDYAAFIRSLFAHRRRTLLNNLRAADIPGPEPLLQRAGIDPARRPETLSRAECLEIYTLWKDNV